MINNNESRENLIVDENIEEIGRVTELSNNAILKEKLDKVEVLILEEQDQEKKNILFKEKEIILEILRKREVIEQKNRESEKEMIETKEIFPLEKDLEVLEQEYKKAA